MYANVLSILGIMTCSMAFTLLLVVLMTCKICYNGHPNDALPIITSSKVMKEVCREANSTNKLIAF